MLKSYKYRLYPTTDQCRKIDHTMGVCRFLYNLALETKLYAYKSHGKVLSSIDLCYQLVGLKKDYPWIGEVDSQAAQASIKRLDKAFQGFFRGGGFPRFKSRRSCGSFQCPNNTRKVDWDNSTLTVPKIKGIPIVLSRRFHGNIKTVTISKTPTGKYFASILVETPDHKILPKAIDPGTTVGIDLGIKSFVVSSDGRSFEPNSRLKNNLDRLKCLSRRVSRKKNGSSNRKKAVKCLSILHEKITNQRTGYIHEITTGLIRDNQADTFVIEDLNVAGMLKNRKLSRAICDASWGEFRRQMQYKCDWYGKNLIIIGRFEPSSKTCADCGKINQELELSDRQWTCKSCGTTHDRDLNAARNIRKMGLNKSNSRRGTPGGPVEPLAIAGAMKQEYVLG